MECKVFQCEISEQLDQELSLPLKRELDQHLQHCSGCRTVFQDLMAIKLASSHLDFPEPPQRVWIGIEEQLQAEGLMRGRWNWRAIRDLISGGIEWGFKPVLAGAMLTLMILLGTLLIYRTPFNKRQPAVVQENAALQNLKLAEAQYQKAIDALAEISRKKMEGLNPQVARIFQENLATMDFYLKECKEAVKSDPDNPLAQNYLLAAYQKKVELLQTLVNSDLL
jgi:hypothetical protein